mmetsp:Transcript_7940/g.29704  ORF Transcript_7940/g.29704 Transcript_7940/m.29704 type:complete len:251 (-) Transcript_7940:48-800(-)
MLAGRLVLVALGAASTAAFRPGLPRAGSTSLCMGAGGAEKLETLPELVVLDLDMCVWSPEMFELSLVPKANQDEVCGDLGGNYGDGVTGAKSGGRTIQLFPGARFALQQFYEGAYPGVRLAAASSADTPLAVSIGRAAMGLIEVVPGVTVREVFAMGWPEGFEGNMQIGRTPPLSSDKSKTHFPILKDQTGVAYDKMLFFDDSLWSDHCALVERRCKGVVTWATPNGLQISDWKAALNRYAEVTATRLAK